ncbi:MAG: hypothetical protein KDD06_08210 [Phaeodactylibacter sp.]|nr:hypothetical protein [Phaeodactylibacter sp.]MCB9265490.1 hypothetical protein [Lewinellaceae bacterium]MCB9289576.1 hypothetical protein [Lewinellaceae bacterium]
MKISKRCSLLAFILPLFFSTSLMAQDTEAEGTGLPGDNFSLEGALELFKKAGSPEEFEKLLNTEENLVNNLDLNEDGDIDYIRVVDHTEGEVHAFVLQVPVSEEESQDIAVIELEKTGTEEAMLQILGDEDIYGQTVIVEPFGVEEKAGGKGGPSVELYAAKVVVNVFFWPSVRFVYTPGYRVWVSPFRWGYYPGWWKPWRPYPLHVYRPRVAVFAPRYHVVTTHRVVRAHKVYAPRRTYSRTVRARTVTVRSRNGAVKATKRTTTVRGANGKVRGKRTTTTVKGQKGNVRAKRSTTTVKRKRGGN